ncbi:hypothetical protein CPAR01_10289 [Colletotrichum paranaense]|uniref:Uncharacterized protein n=1 Tax=Colletotrichum paranaense TaxID=1914294 RepID=A0ABQ9SDT6_9PEZI|nr:uncharacterized protein CPAR01_10289 [Colletotrichum paranaense]KAK1533581.1 hypothetical protein CPAR01_10289 [Colletotrichum paranaense]
MDLLHCRRLGVGGVWSMYKFLPSPSPPFQFNCSNDLAFFDVPRTSERSAHISHRTQAGPSLRRFAIHSTTSPISTTSTSSEHLPFSGLHTSTESSQWVTTAPTTTAPSTATTQSPALAIDVISAQHQKEALPLKMVYFPRPSDGVHPPPGPPTAIAESSGPAGRPGTRE